MKNSSNSVVSRGMGIVCGVIGLTWLVTHFLPLYIFPWTLFDVLLRSYSLIDIVIFDPVFFLWCLFNTLIFVFLFVFTYLGILRKQNNRYLSIVFLISSIFALLIGMGIGTVTLYRLIIYLLVSIIAVLISIQGFAKKESRKIFLDTHFEDYMAGEIETSQQVQQFLLMNSNKFEGADHLVLQKTLNGISQEKLQQLYAVELIDPQMVLICSLLFGGLGVDRFLIGDVGLGILKLITAGGLGFGRLLIVF
ncbi:TPA: TM2 domain-containing protein [Streptococcus suis]